MLEIKAKIEAGKAFVLQHKALALALGVIFLFLAPFLFSFSPKDQRAGNSAGGQWQVYESEALGFSVSHPAGWSVKEADAESGPDILVLDSGGKAFVRIRGFLDPNLDSEEAISSSIAEYQKSLASQEGVRVSDFQTEGIKNNIGGFWLTGEFPVKGSAYRFFERGWLSLAGQALILRAADAPRV